MIDAWIARVANATNLSPQIVKTVLATLAVLVVIWVLRMAALRVVRRRVVDVKRHYYWRRGINYTAGVVAVLWVGTLWLAGSGLSNIGTFLGLVSAGLAIALQDPLANFAGWIFILTRRPFNVGDRIEVIGHCGDVIDVGLFQTYLMECGHWVDADQSTGRIISIPNGAIFKSSLANYTRGFEHIWNEIPVLVTFESDWRRAKQILTDIANTHASPLSEGAQEQIRRAASTQMIFFTKLTPIVYTNVKDCGVLLTIRYLTLPRQRRSSAERIWEAVLDAFAQEPNIDLAYPTTRAYLNYREGKPQLQAPGSQAPSDPGSIAS